MIINFCDYFVLAKVNCMQIKVGLQNITSNLSFFITYLDGSLLEYCSPISEAIWVNCGPRNVSSFLHSSKVIGTETERKQLFDY